MKRVVVLATAVVAALPAASVDSARPPQLLSYVRGPYGRATICLARPNGTQAVQVTAQRKDDRTPAWSPNGKYVAFARQFKGSDRVFDVLVADTRGRVLANLSDGQSVMETHPTWAPDSWRIAFSGGWRGSFIWLSDREGGWAQRFLEDAGTPAWSPDGKTLAFSSGTYRPGHGWEQRVETIGADGTGRRVVAVGATDPTWSPDGRRLAFVKGPRHASEIVVANADGTGARALTSSRESDLAPAWSPNGKWIAFQRGAVGDITFRDWIVVVDAETGAERWTVRHRNGVYEPTWRPQVLLPRARRPSCR